MASKAAEASEFGSIGLNSCWTPVKKCTKEPQIATVSTSSHKNIQKRNKFPTELSREGRFAMKVRMECSCIYGHIWHALIRKRTNSITPCLNLFTLALRLLGTQRLNILFSIVCEAVALYSCGILCTLRGFQAFSCTWWWSCLIPGRFMVSGRQCGQVRTSKERADQATLLDFAWSKTQLFLAL